MTLVYPCEMQVRGISRPNRVVAVEFGEKNELFVDGSFTVVKIRKLRVTCGVIPRKVRFPSSSNSEE